MLKNKRRYNFKKLLFTGSCGIFLVLILILIINTISFSSKQKSFKKVNLPSLNRVEMAKKLAKSVQFKTISSQNQSLENQSEFVGLVKYLKHAFPLTFSNLEVKYVNHTSLLLKWKGSNQSMAPGLLMGHMDVVPIEKETLSSWGYGPFSGKIANGFVWGRGTLDDKTGVLSVLQAVELLLQSNYKPHRTFYLAFGHDEEIGGNSGAKEIAKILKARGVNLAFVLDEGLVVADGKIVGVPDPVALIGIAEKGYLTLKLSASSAGGHSSTPPLQTTVGILSSAIDKLESNQLPARLDIARQLFNYIGPEMPFFKKLAIANLWLFSPIIKSQFEKKPSTNALIRTTTASTMFKGSPKENVLPSTAEALINFRILPGDSIESVKKHVKNTINDNRISISPMSKMASNPSKMSPINSSAFSTLEKTIRQIYPEAIVAPSIVLGGTDSRHFEEISRSIYRFRPWFVTEEDLKRIHGKNERISLIDYERCVKFYYQFIKNSSELNE